jgi:hypothetical protein
MVDSLIAMGLICVTEPPVAVALAARKVGGNPSTCQRESSKTIVFIFRRVSRPTDTANNLCGYRQRLVLLLRKRDVALLNREIISSRLN